MGLILCNGYVTESPFSKLNSLIIKSFLCNGYVIESSKILFDGYLTERASYPQLQVRPYLTNAPFKQVRKALTLCISAASLFDGYLTVAK